MLEFIALILAGCALVVALLGNDKVTNLLQGHKKEDVMFLAEQVKDLKSKVSKIDNLLIESQRLYAEIPLRLRNLEDKINYLETQVRDSFNANKVNNPILPNIPQDANVANGKSVEKNKTLYVQEFVNGEILNEKLLENKSKFTKFIVTVSGNKATYEVPTDSTCQEKLINGYSTIQPFLDELSTVDAPSGIENVQAGTLVLKEGKWNIERKLKVRLV